MSSLDQQVSLDTLPKTNYIKINYFTKFRRFISLIIYTDESDFNRKKYNVHLAYFELSCFLLAQTESILAKE
jgi:hypothetical protein